MHSLNLDREREVAGIAKGEPKLPFAAYQVVEVSQVFAAVPCGEYLRCPASVVERILFDAGYSGSQLAIAVTRCTIIARCNFLLTPRRRNGCSTTIPYISVSGCQLA